jgi:hypothetical protein
LSNGHHICVSRSTGNHICVESGDVKLNDLANYICTDKANDQIYKHYFIKKAENGACPQNLSAKSIGAKAQLEFPTGG